MKKEIIIVPDVHGRSFWRKILNDKTDRPIVFLGDYVDPYFYEGLMYDDAIRELNDIITFARTRPNVTLLYGNHCIYPFIDDLDRSYCSNRYNFSHDADYAQIYINNKDLFKFAYQIDNILFTHAGVTTKWLTEYELNNIPSNEICDYINFISPEVLFKIGKFRGGFGYGSPLWADIAEMVNWSAYEGELIQIIGHTQLKQPGTYLHRKNFYCCDSKEVFVFDGETLKPHNV